MFEDLFTPLYGSSATDIIIAVIDVLLVYYVIYQVLLLLKGTKAFQVLVGLLLVVVLYFISQDEYVGFSTLNWLLDKFIASFVVILVILFQEDIRRGLSEMGRSSRFTGLNQIEQAHFLEEIVKACTLLSERRIGALIAIEREASLADYGADGIQVDASVTRELLVSLFVPFRSNPTHDGAVVIKKGRISAAGCVLPLTSNPRIDRNLGTRHRAALGLSESTDAAIVIVSEETGIVSVAFREELTRRLNGDELRDLLQKLFDESVMHRQTLKGPRGLLKRLRMPRSRSRSSNRV